MRIAQLAPGWLPTGGLATYVHLLTRVLAAAGHEVLVVHGDTDSATAAAPAGVTVRAAPAAFGASSDAGARGRVQAILRDFAPDVLHFHGTNDFLLEADLRRRYPAVKTLHVYDFCPSGTKYHYRPGVACVEQTGWPCLPRQVFRRCTLSKRPQVIWAQYRHAVIANAHHQTFRHLVVASEFVRREAIRTGFDGARVHVVPYFTTLPETVTPPAPREVLFVGRVVREKGADLLIDALASTPAPWRCVIAGDGMDVPTVRRRAEALGVADRVVFAGWLTGEALAAAYRRAAVVAVPSRWPEPFGIIGLEAFAHARPVVAFRVGGIPEWLDDGSSGYGVTPLDTGAFGRRIAELLDHPGRAAAMGAMGRARVMRDFLSAPHLARLMPIYGQVRAGS